MKHYYIDITIEDEANLYNSFDPNGVVQNDEFIDYIAQRYN